MHTSTRVSRVSRSVNIGTLLRSAAVAAAAEHIRHFGVVSRDTPERIDFNGNGIHFGRKLPLNGYSIRSGSLVALVPDHKNVYATESFESAYVCDVRFVEERRAGRLLDGSTVTTPICITRYYIIICRM